MVADGSPGRAALAGERKRGLTTARPSPSSDANRSTLPARWRRGIDFEPASDGEEAGLTVWMNPTHHYDLFVTRQDGQRRVIVRRRIGSLVADVAQVIHRAGTDHAHDPG